MNHLYLYRIMILKTKKLGSTKDPIVTFRFFDTESKTEITNISMKTKKTSKIFWGINLGSRYFRFMKKTRAQKSHATVPLIKGGN